MLALGKSKDAVTALTRRRQMSERKLQSDDVAASHGVAASDAVATMSAPRRQALKTLAAGGAALALGGIAPAVLGQSKKFAGVTINGACFQHVFQTYLKELLPEFEAQSGMKVNLDLQAFPVYNQRMDL